MNNENDGDVLNKPRNYMSSFGVRANLLLVNVYRSINNCLIANSAITLDTTEDCFDYDFVKSTKTVHVIIDTLQSIPNTILFNVLN